FLGWTAPLGLQGSCASCEVDHGAAEGLVAAIEGGPSDGLLIGHLCLEPDGAGGIELALVVTDAYQHQGLGRRLFEAALIWAQDHDIGWLSATALADNGAVLRLLSSAPAGATERSLGSGVVEIRIPISRRGAGIWP
ncbi:MAG: GNAT family N-acetyltransferase, partial [Candidatus Limnocylindrales bacterium]